MSNLTKEDIYAMSAKMMETNAPIKQDHLVTFVRLLNKDIFRQDDNLRLLRILQVLLIKIKDGIYPKVPQLGETLTSLIHVSMKKVNEAATGPAQLSLKILLETPDEIIFDYHADMNGPLVLLLENYLSSSPNLSHQLVKDFLAKYLSCPSQSKKEEFAKVGLQFFLSRLVPFVFLDINDNREFGIDLINEFLPYIVKNNYFNERHWLKIYDNIIDVNKYPKTLSKLLNNNDPNWHSLWIMLTKLCGTELHRMGRSINPFLSVLQEAFKKNVECKYYAFLCLKSLIENFALEKSILFNPSRVKVLSIALEINNAKTEKVALVKFDVWWYLISLMKSKISDFSSIIFLPFLKFCFGECDKNNSRKTNAIYPGESFESIRRLAIKSLTEMFGHSDCPGCVGSKFKRLDGSIINSVLLDDFSDVLVYSLKKSTKYAVTHMLKGDKTTFEELKLNVRCLWFSFIKLSNNTSLKKFSEIFKNILILFMELVEENSQDALFAEVIMTLILPSIIMKNVGYSVTSFNDPSIKLPNDLTPIQFLLKSVLIPKLYHQDTMSELHFDFKNMIEIGMIGDSHRFSTWLIKELFSNGHSPQIWCCLSNAHTNNPEKINFECYRSIIIWPITEYTSNTKIVDVFSAWTKFYNIPISKLASFEEKDMSQIDEEITNSLLKMCTKFNKSEINLTPLFFLPVMIKKNFEATPGKMAAINRLTIGLEKYFTMLQSTKMSYNLFIGLSECLNNLSIVLSDCYSYHVTTTSSKNITSILNKAIKLIILFFQQNYQESDSIKLDFHASIQLILNSLNRLTIPIYFSMLREGLLNLLDILMKTLKNPEIENECSNLLKSIMDPNSKTIKLEKSDIIKIQMILNSKNNKKPKDSLSNSTEPSSFSFPSHIKNGKKKNNTKDEDFVVIKSSWKFDPKNLTEHQKDVLKRRRDDIPALYEDLSQSQDENSMKTWRVPGGDSTNSQEQSSQGIDLNYTNSKSTSEDPNKQIENKVIVENEKKSKNVSPIEIKSKNQSAAQNFKGTCSRMIKNNVDKKPDTPESNKLNVNITNSNDSKVDTPKSKKSIYSRLNESLQSLKSTDDKNETYVVNSNPDSQTISCTENIEKDEIFKSKNTTPVNKKIIIIKKDSVKKINGELSGVLNCKSPNNLNSNVIDDKPLRKRKASTELEEDIIISDAVVHVITDTDVNDQNEEKTNETVQKSNTPLNRPLRVRRKPNKFIGEESVDGKKSKEDMKNDKNNLVIVDGANLNDVDNVKNNVSTPERKNSSENSDSNIFESFGTPKSSKKKSRLINQLVINTKEGHPLMEINSIESNNSSSRKTRRSLGMTSIKIKSGKSPKIVLTNLKKEMIPKKKLCVKINPVNEETHNGLNNEIENSETKLDKLIKKNKQSHSINENTTENLDSPRPLLPNDFTNENSHSDNQGDLPVESEVIKSEANEDCKNISECELTNAQPLSSISNEATENIVDENKDCNFPSDNDSNDIESKLRSIFSQETEAITQDKEMPLSNESKNDTNDTIFLNNREPFLNDNSSQNFDDCSPDCIESSQDESLSSISLKMIMSKPKTIEAIIQPKIEENKISTLKESQAQPEINKTKFNLSILTTQELAEADTEILTCESINDNKNSEQNENPTDISHKHIINIDLDDSPVSENKDCSDVSMNSSCNMKSENFDLSDAPSSPINPVKNISILSSPCKDDIEDRNKEFLNNTMDISPIKENEPEILPFQISADKMDLENSVIEDISTKPKLQPVVTSPDIFACEKPVSTKTASVDSISPPKSNITTMPNTNNKSSKNFPSLSHINSRTVQMLNMCMFGDANHVTTSKDTYTDKKKESITEKNNTDVHFNNADTQSLFELTKMLPCLTASPAGPILKRKLEADELSMSPSSKKKRVSFHDPLVSTMVNVEKYIGSKSNASPLSKDMLRIKRNRMMTPRSLTNKMEMEAIATSSTEPIKNVVSIDSAIEVEANSASISDICSLTIDVPKPVDIAQNDMFDDQVAIYPNLVDCETSISEIASHLSSSLWKEDFIKEINNKITTIGDLAKLTEADINRLPIKYPKVETVKQTLATFEAKMNRDLFVNDNDFTLESKNDKVDIINTDEKNSLNDLTSCFVSKIDKPLPTESDILNEDSQNIKINHVPIVNSIDMNCSVNEDTSVSSQDITLSVELPINQEVKTHESEEVLACLIEEQTEKTLKTVVDKVNHNTILDNIPFASLLSYLKSKMNNDDDREKILETLNLDKVNNIKKQNLDNSLKLFHKKLSVDFEKLLTSINEFVDS